MAKNKNIIFWIIGIAIFLLILIKLPISPLFAIITPEEEVFEEPREKLYEYYDKGEIGNISFYGGAKVGNVFTVGAVGPEEDFEIDSIEVKLKRQGSVGTVYIEIRKSGTKGRPYGDILSSGSINGNYLSDSNFEWIELEMSPFIFNAGEKYVFFLYITGGDSSNTIWVRVYNKDLYVGGDALTYSGEGWGIYDYFNVLFKIKGIGPV